ncbi:MAG: T9SS type A sorting domain-containing protein [Flavobacteriales bacterium]|nr:T9SS type A sorting domain-containing protein [Flavobacteriales bacterium]
MKNNFLLLLIFVTTTIYSVTDYNHVNNHCGGVINIESEYNSRVWLKPNGNTYNSPPTYNKISSVTIYHNGGWQSITTPTLNLDNYYPRQVITIMYYKGSSSKKRFFLKLYMHYPFQYYLQLNDNICAGESFDVMDYTNIPPNTTTGGDHYTITTSNDTFLSGVSLDEVTIPATTNASTYNVSIAGRIDFCLIDLSDVIEIRAKPIITWPTQFPQTNVIFDTDLSLYPLNAISSSNWVMTYEGVGTSNTNFKPSYAGEGNHTITAISTTQYGCTNDTTQTVTITHDPGVPKTPIGYDYNVSEGYRFEYYNILTDDLWAFFDLCDGQTFNFKVREVNINSIDSVNYYYVHNGIEDTIGRFHENELANYTIPYTGSTRTDYIYASRHSNLDVEGGRFGVSILVNSTTANENELVCIDGMYEVLNIDYNTSGILTSHIEVEVVGFTPNYFGDRDTLFHANYFDSIKFEKSRNYVWRDLNTNILDTTYQFIHNSVNKSTTYIREEFTILPYKIGEDFFQNSPVSYNPQICRKYDTITVVMTPIIDYIYSGDSVIIGGTSVEIVDNSTLSDSTSFNFFNIKGEQFGDTIIDTLFVPLGDVLITAYDLFGCSSDSLFKLVETTNNPGLPYLDEQTDGLIYPIQNNLISYNGLTDSNTNEIHICDGQEISIILDISKLKYNNGIDSVEYSYLENGNEHTVGKYHILTPVTYTIPKTNGKRVDTLYSKLFTLLDSVGNQISTPVNISYSLQRTSSTQILNCDEVLNYTNIIGQNQSDFGGLLNWSYQGYNADFTTFSTEFRDVNGNIQFYSGGNFNYTLGTGLKVDTIFKREITRVPFKNNTNNLYYNAIQNPQECTYNDTIIIVRPPIASYTYSGLNQIQVGTPVRHISTSLYSDSITWDFHDGSSIYNGDTIWHYIYDIGYNDITITGYDKYGCIDSYTDYGYIEVIDWTGIEEEQNTISEVLSYPNPMQDNLTLKITSAEAVYVTIFILDMSGRFILEKTINLVNSENTINLDVSMLSSGMYNFKIIGKNINLSQKLIKK